MSRSKGCDINLLSNVIPVSKFTEIEFGHGNIHSLQIQTKKEGHRFIVPLRVSLVLGGSRSRDAVRPHPDGAFPQGLPDKAFKHYRDRDPSSWKSR